MKTIMDYMELCKIFKYILSHNRIYLRSIANFNEELIKELKFNKSKTTLRRYFNCLVKIGLFRKEPGKQNGLKSVQQVYTYTPELQRHLVSIANIVNKMINDHVDLEKLAELDFNVLEQILERIRFYGRIKTSKIIESTKDIIY